MTPLDSPHLRALEAESIYILRETIAGFRKPVLLYSIGKDSSVLLHLCRKAFYPAPVPFPLLHIDTGWKFKDMVLFRDKTAREHNLDLIVHRNEQGLADGISPLTHGASSYTDIMKTQALRQALDAYGFDAAIGGARRDEDAARAKERIFSLRSAGHRWDPRSQRPEFGRTFNTGLAKGETMRVFPLSNWTEIDVWSYIQSENINVVPLYFAAQRPIIQRNGMLLLPDDERLIPLDGETVTSMMVRFRTLGCYPLTGAMHSEAKDVESIIQELKTSRFSERQGRAIDHDEACAMERKKQEGYF